MLLSTFQPLYEQHKWGTNLPYMISGANSIPQKEVMEWQLIEHIVLTALLGL